MSKFAAVQSMSTTGAGARTALSAAGHLVRSTPHRGLVGSKSWNFQSSLADDWNLLRTRMFRAPIRNSTGRRRQEADLNFFTLPPPYVGGLRRRPFRRQAASPSALRFALENL